MDFIRAHGILVVACLAGVEGIFCAILIRRSKKLKSRLLIAVAAAEDAARAAALAAPGGIDPEIVIQLLRSGRPTSLESVYQLMDQQAAAEESGRRQYDVPPRHAAAQAPTPGATDSTAAPGPMTDEERTEMQRRLGRYG